MDVLEQALDLFFTSPHLRTPYKLLQCDFLTDDDAHYLCHLFNKWYYYRGQGQLDDEGMFYVTGDNIEADLNMKRFRQEQCVKTLSGLGILECKVKGLPARKHFKINIQRLLERVYQFDGGQQTALTPTNKPDCSLPTDITNIKKLTSESTGETSFLPVNPAGNDAGEGSVLRERKKSSRLRSGAQASHTRKVILPPIKKPLIVPESIHLLILFWKDLGLRLPGIDSKAYPRMVSYLRQLKTGKLFGVKYSDEQIRKVMLSFSKAASSNDYLPVPGEYKEWLANMYLPDFIYNPYIKGNGVKSYFKEFEEKGVQTVPPHKIEQLKDNHPEVTKIFMDYYRTHKHGRVQTELNISEQNKFIAASKRLTEFYNTYRDKIALGVDSGLRGLANLLCMALEKAVDGDFSKLTPGWFGSDMTFNDRLPAYLEEQAYWAEDYKMSPFDPQYLEQFDNR